MSEAMFESCILCGANTKVLFEGVSSNFTRGKAGKPFDLYICTSCNLLKTVPCPSKDQLRDLYHFDYPYVIHEAVAKEKSFRSRQLLRHFNFIGGSKLIDLGCGDGSFVFAAVKMNLDAHGVDINAPSLEDSSRFFNQDIEVFLKSGSDKKYDFVIIQHTLEHLIDPLNVLSGIKSNLLEKEGTLLIVVPNSDSLTARLFKSKWGYWQVPVHVHHFSELSINILVESVGFEIVSIRTRGADSLFWILTLGNLLKIKNRGSFSKLHLLLIKAFSQIGRYWVFIGSEDLIVEAKVRAKASI